MRRPSVISLVLIGLALLAGVAGEVVAQAGPSAYRIGPRDVLDLRVFEVPELNLDSLDVSERGLITLPLIGEVQVAGLTEGELAAQLEELLESRYVQRATVVVEVKEFRSKPITVVGAVKQPGNLTFSGRYTLLEALTAAGGVVDQSSDILYILRRSENGLSDQLTIRISDLLVKGDPKLNLPLLANDLINVPVAEQVTVFLLGEVASRGAISFKSSDRVTVLTAIARAGGLSERASRKVQIKRAGDDGRQQQIEVDYKRILDGRDPDVELLDGDILVVKESFF